MSIKREHLWVAVALLLGFSVGIWYAKETSTKMYLSSLAGKPQSNGTASIPVFGMVTAAQGIGENGGGG